MTTHTNEPTIILIPGHWLGAWAWDEVAEYLTAAGRQAVALTLPGLDEGDPERMLRTLDDQAAAIKQAMDDAGASTRPVVIAAHSGANAPVSLVLDRYPELVKRVVWIDSGPVSPGSAFAPDLPAEVAELPLPAFDALGQQSSLDGLSNQDLERLRARAVPEPGPVLRQPVELGNEARLRVPTTLVCCSITSAQILELVDAGHPMFAEVANLENREFVDLPTGHWPMWSRAEGLAGVISGAAIAND
ncbi:alpha/beta fold hydrolase [Lysinibacter cavernae]|uniref:Pimeloyl-ACP methyl ester carboxylesterase n=1 Tax=Lysinibacter cavernae TaxID=1640652 RepID=A0A7X5R317_9MICO|nr:alpha/beta hydrolase family protein [Lysinibacter cavernae]NIH54691.1 pimeloyl-ACP methyl ester carboxylesterase [Lysinibacter cavernae]